MSDALDLILSSAQEQGTGDWFADRLGKFTSSNLYKVMQTGRAKDSYFSDTAKTYIYERAYERLTGVSHDTFDGSIATEWGNEYEPIARKAYEELKGVEVAEGGFYSFNKYFGGSSDGYVGDDGLIEIKCPFNSVYHLKTAYEGFIKPEYIVQCHGNLIATGRKWCDFVSFDPRVKGRKIVVIRIERDDKYVAEILERLYKADEVCRSIVDTMITTL
jgi:predicted phage-related endonuclease